MTDVNKKNPEHLFLVDYNLSKWSWSLVTLNNIKICEAE